MASSSDHLSSKTASNEAFNELEQLRLLVFGQAKQQLDSRIDALQSQLNEDVNMLQAQFNQRITALDEKLAEQHEQLVSQINDLANIQENDKTELVQSHASLSSQLEMAENASKDDSSFIHKRIDDEVSKLENEVSKATQDLLNKLEQVTKELSGSKTDRKKLALLLSTMASNLDADD